MSARVAGSPAPAPPWPAMLLTAGLGTRLRPLTRLRAKPSLPVSGLPLAGRILKWLATSGVSEAVLNLHHRPESITAAIGDGAQYGMRVRYSWEPQILGSAGGPARALSVLDAPRFYLVNGDTLTDVDLAAMAAAHVESAALVTMALVANPDPAHYGGVLVDGTGAVTGFSAKAPGNPGLHFVGVQVVDAEVFAGLDPNLHADTVGRLYGDVIARQPGRVRAFVSRASFRDIGTAADYLATCADLGRIERGTDVIVEDGAEVDRLASLATTVVWPGARVAGDVMLDECVVAGGALVPPGSHFRRSVLRPLANPDERDPFENPVGALLVSPLDVRRATPTSRTAT